MDAKLTRIKELIDAKEKIDGELDALVGGAVVKETKQRPCKICGQTGHRSDKCPTKPHSSDELQ